MTSFREPLTLFILFRWHARLFSGPKSILPPLSFLNYMKKRSLLINAQHLHDSNGSISYGLNYPER